MRRLFLLFLTLLSALAQNPIAPDLPDPRIASASPSPSPSSTPAPIVPDLPDPRIVIVGPTGAGKSSMANALLGCDPRSSDCMFVVCPGLDSCTKRTTYGTGQWLGTGPNFTVVDTPGFGDSDDQDEELIEEMMDILGNTLDHADTLLLLLKGTETRFTNGLQTMLKRMTIIFGEDWWNYAVVGVSFWPYDQHSIDGRVCDPDYPQYCKDEAWFKREITKQLHDKFGVTRNFTFVFTDSYSQSPGPPGYNTEDELQQYHWQQETMNLWNITLTREEPFDFMTVDDLIEDNAKLKAEVKWLNDVITKNISDLKDSIIHNTDIIDVVGTRVTLNEEALVKANTDIEKANTDIEKNTDGVLVLDSRLEDVETKVVDLVMMPVGTIIAWVTKPTTDTSYDDTVDLPDGWQRCDGSPIRRPSIWAGKPTPDLNKEKRFLRGGSDKEMLTLEADQMQQHQHKSNEHSHGATSTAGSHSHGYGDGYNRMTRDCGHASGSHWCFDYTVLSKTTDSAAVGVTTRVHEGKSDISDVKGATAGTETRPKNMNILYVIRVF